MQRKVQNMSRTRNKSFQFDASHYHVTVQLVVNQLHCQLYNADSRWVTLEIITSFIPVIWLC